MRNPHIDHALFLRRVNASKAKTFFQFPWQQNGRPHAIEKKFRNQQLTCGARVVCLWLRKVCWAKEETLSICFGFVSTSDIVCNGLQQGIVHRVSTKVSCRLEPLVEGASRSDQGQQCLGWDRSQRRTVVAKLKPKNIGNHCETVLNERQRC